MPDFATARQRITEYLRQRRLQNRDLGNVIHGTHTDPNAELAELTISDVEEVLQTAPDATPGETRLAMFHACFSVLEAHESWQMDAAPDEDSMYPVTCVGCPDNWHTYAADTHAAREVFRGHQAVVLSTKIRDMLHNTEATK